MRWIQKHNVLSRYFYAPAAKWPFSASSTSISVNHPLTVEETPRTQQWLFPPKKYASVLIWRVIKMAHFEPPSNYTGCHWMTGAACFKICHKTKPSKLVGTKNFCSLVVPNGAWITHRVILRVIGTHPALSLSCFTALALFEARADTLSQGSLTKHCR